MCCADLERHLEIEEGMPHSPVLTAFLNGVQRDVSSAQEIDRLVSDAELADPCELLVEERVGEEQGLPLPAQPRVIFLRAGPVSRLTFLDEDQKEHRAGDGCVPPPVGTMTFKLRSGDIAVEAADLLFPERALEAVRQFLSKGGRPTWLTYRRVA